MKKFLITHNHIKSKSGVSAISYGLIVMGISFCVLFGAYELGGSIGNIFTTTGNTMNLSTIESEAEQIQGSLAQYGLDTPNPALASWQQQEITEAALEIASGASSLSCLEALNGSDAPAMNNVMATCVAFGSKTGLNPPAKPVREIVYTGPNGQEWLADISQDGSVYMMGQAGNNPNSVIYFNDGYIDTTSGYNCNSPSNASGYGSSSSQYDLSALSQSLKMSVVSCKTPYAGYNNVGTLGGTGVTDGYGTPLSTSTFTPTNANAQNPLGVDSAFSF